MKWWIALFPAVFMVVVILVRDFMTFPQFDLQRGFEQGGVQLERRDQAQQFSDVSVKSDNRTFLQASKTNGTKTDGVSVTRMPAQPETFSKISTTRNDTRSKIIEVKDSKRKAEEVKLSGQAFVWKETIRFLFKHSDRLDEMLARPPLSIYVYDTLPKVFDVLEISQCIYAKYQSNMPRSNCNWEPKVCKETQTDATPKALYSGYRNNYNHDVAIIQTFQNYPGRVMDPNKAEIFVVPYPHKSHCLCVKDLNSMASTCKYGEAEFRDNILANLPYYNESSLNRHLFIQGVDWSLASAPQMTNKSLVLTLGDARPCVGTENDASCGAIVVPYLNTNPEYQPNYLASRSEEWWTTRPRLYSVGAIMGRKKILKERMQFLNESVKILGGDTLGGLPIKVINLRGVRKLSRQDEAMEIYRNSTVCPILAGDGCPQKRIFDVLMSGCIPVVFKYDVSNEKGWPSWFKPGACSIRVTYPFAKGTFFGDPKAGIDWESLVIPVNGTCGFPCMKSAIEAVMNDSDRLKGLRRRIRQVASLFSYGLEAEENGSSDAFAALLVSLKHHLVSADTGTNF